MANATRKRTVPVAPGEFAPLYRSNAPFSPFKTITNQQETPVTNQPKTAKTAKTPKTEQPAVTETPKPAPAPKAPKPEVSKLAKVIESQQAATMWQYARIAKFIVQRIEAGQPRAEAFDEVVKQTVTILDGILGEHPASSRDNDVDAATKAFFFLYSPKSLTRERGPKSDS